MTKTETETTNKSSRKPIYIAVGVIAILLIASLAWLYTGRVSSAKQKVFDKLPLPVALVNGRVVTSTELAKRVTLAQDLLTNTDTRIDNLADTILDQLIDTKKVEILAAKHDSTPTSADIDNAFNGVLKQFPNQSEQDLAAELQNTYGLDLATFKKEVLRESVIKENLSLWHNRQESLNAEAYTKARQLLSQLDNGGDFDTVAQTNSDDLASNAFAGDSGFVAFNDLLPEFQAAVKDLAINDNKIVASRYGIHVLHINAIAENPDSQDNKTYNIQQIFLAPSDFNEWLNTEFENISSIKLL